MARLNSQQEDLASRLLFDIVSKGIKKDLAVRLSHLIKTFSRTTTPPRPHEKAQLVLNIEIPGQVLYELENRVKLPQ